MSTILTKLLDVQKQMPSIQTNSINPHFKNSYVSLDGVLEVVLPLLHAQGLLLMQPPTNVDGKPALRTVIADADTGEKTEDVMMLVLDKDNPQGQGSALTYAKRYALLSMLGLTADADDDGAKGSTKIDPLAALKAEVSQIAVAGGATMTAQGIADYFDITLDNLQNGNEEFLRGLVATTAG